MTLIDWLIVLGLNGTVIAIGFYLARGTTTSSAWFLGSRALPWWGIGLSMFATNVDNADLVSVTGATYSTGMHIITVYALGSAVGGILAAFFVVPAIYRAGFYTNAEYLEARFGPTTRVLSALIQIQYRSSMLGLMIWSVYLLLTGLEIADGARAWALIVAAVVLSGMYTAWGGLKSVVWTDALQGLVMMAGGLVIFLAVWNAAGGWDGLQEKLATADSEAQASGKVDAEVLEKRVPASELTQVSSFRGRLGNVSPWLIVVGWTIIGSGYWTVNHTQTMRLMGARSLWDVKMAAIAGVALSMPIMLACSLMGVCARGLYPDFANGDEVFPFLANIYLGPGLKGLVVAGIVAAAVSTFDSMGSALSAIFTRDIYARFIATDRDDAHYVLVGRLATVGILVLGFLYLPFIIRQDYMITAFTTLIPVFVTPLLVVYLVGIFTRFHRWSGIVGLLGGGAYGVVALVAREFPEFLALGSQIPQWLTAQWWAYSWSVLITLAFMAAVTLVKGRAPASGKLELREQGWLARSRDELPELREHPFANRVPLFANPLLYAAALLAFSVYVVFGPLW